MSVCRVTDYPFCKNIHICTPASDDSIKDSIGELRVSLEEEAVYQQYRLWCTDEQMHRFLIARNFNQKQTKEMILSALKWRQTRIPVAGVESLDGWEDKMSIEGETGKIYIPGYDKYHRPVLVFDNTVQNTSNPDGQLAFLAWYLEHACRLMPTGIDKYVVFMHLEAFSFFNCPPMKTIMETIFMVCTAFPERLGHCVAYRAPGIFKTVFNGVKSFIDPKTVSKMLFVSGDVGDDSDNDRLLKEIIGDNWKELCGAEQTIHRPGCTPGYRHAVYWPWAMERYQAMLEKERQGLPGSIGVQDETLETHEVGGLAVPDNCAVFLEEPLSPKSEAEAVLALQALTLAASELLDEGGKSGNGDEEPISAAVTETSN